jgi:hypothetical protein
MTKLIREYLKYLSCAVLTWISGFRQHALLNVVHWHYINKEYVAARKVHLSYGGRNIG